MKQVRRFELTVEVEQAEEGGYNALCVELGTPSCGDTFEEARQNLFDAVRVHVDSLKETGDMERVFQEKEITIYTMTVPDGEVPETTSQGSLRQGIGARAPAPMNSPHQVDVRDTAGSMRVAVYA